jgi:hypothetical protein
MDGCGVSMGKSALSQQGKIAKLAVNHG